MALRMVEIVFAESEREALLGMLEEHESDPDMILWIAPLDGERLSLKIVMEVHETESVLDVVERRFAFKPEKYRVVVSPVSATIPRLEVSVPEEEAEAPEQVPEQGPNRNRMRISREELYANVRDMARNSRVFVVLVILSSIIAAIGLMRDNVAIIIGAMVLAPLLGPNVGLSLATTLGDGDLGRESLGTSLTGSAVAVAVALAIGLVFRVDPEIGQLASRTVITTSDIVLALVSGIAGILAVTQGVPTSMVGVMVALALLPPLVAFGLFLGSAQWGASLGAGLLFLGNIICLNLAGVLTFLVQGVQPLTWWKKQQARKTIQKVVLLWGALLAALLAVVVSHALF